MSFTRRLFSRSSLLRNASFSRSPVLCSSSLSLRPCALSTSTRRHFAVGPGIAEHHDSRQTPDLPPMYAPVEEKPYDLKVRYMGLLRALPEELELLEDNMGPDNHSNYNKFFVLTCLGSFLFGVFCLFQLASLMPTDDWRQTVPRIGHETAPLPYGNPTSENKE